jgi:type II secretory pathway component GspD/PulD (secretin)
MNHGKRLTAICLAALTAMVLMLPVGSALAADKGTATVVTPVSAPAEPEQMISLELKGADIRDALDALAKLSGTNIIADQSVVGNVTVTLNQVPFGKALDLVVKANGFAYRWVGNILVVASPDRVMAAADDNVVQPFTLKYVSPTDIKKALSLVIPEGRIVVDEKRPVVLVKATPGELQRVEQLIKALDVKATEQIESRAYPLRSATPDAIKSALASSGLTELTFDSAGKLVIVRASSARMDEAARIIDAVESAAKAQVTPTVTSDAEARVYDLQYANTDEVKAALSLVVPANQIQVGKKDRQIVVRGGKADQQAAAEVIRRLDVAPQQIVIEARVEELYVNAMRTLGLDWDIPFKLATGDSGIVEKVTLPFTATLNALETNGDAALLASPRVAVVDGTEASILIGDRIPITIQNSTTENGVTRTITTVDYINVGVQLKVTPRYNGSGMITVRINPEVSTITGTTTQGYPQIRTRSTSTVMALKDGETAAIGGLIQQNDVNTTTQVPVLGDLPVLGRLFQKVQKTKKQTEIVIFLTPRLVPANQGAPLAPVVTVVPVEAPATQPAKVAPGGRPVTAPAAPKK